jgi:hypothetical protein
LALLTGSIQNCVDSLATIQDTSKFASRSLTGVDLSEFFEKGQ